MSRLPVKVVQLVLPLPPGVNEYWRLFTPPKGGRPHMVLSEAGRVYKRRVRAMVRQAVAGTFTGPLFIRVDVFRRRKAGDVDRSPKALMDTLQRDEDEDWPGLYLNDGQAVRMSVEHWDHQPERARVQITIIEDSNPRVPPQDFPISPAEQALLAQVDAELAAIRKKNNEKAKRRKAASTTEQAPTSRKSSRTGYGDLKRMATSASHPPRRK